MVNERMGNTMEEQCQGGRVACMSDVPEQNKNEFVEGKGVVLVTHSGAIASRRFVPARQSGAHMGEFSQETAASWSAN